MSAPVRGETLPSVLHLTSYYPPDRIGGVGEHVRVLHQGYIDRGGHSEILTSGVTTDDRGVRRIAKSVQGFTLLSWLHVRRASRFEIVQAHHGEGVLLLLLLRIRRRRPMVLLMNHVDVRRREAADRSHVFQSRRFGPSRVSELIQRIYGFVKTLVERVAWALADAVVVETSSVRDELQDLRPEREITVIPHGLGPGPGEVDLPAQVEVLYVGTPGIRKRTHLLPAILEGIRREVPDARLRIVGFGREDEPVLVNEALRLGVAGSIDFVGRVRSEQVVPFYRAAKVLIVPSAYEGLPMVLLEAMREGLPVVATKVSGHPDAIEDGRNGYLVTLDDPLAMANRVVELLTDEAAREKMGKGAMQTVNERFKLKKEIDAYCDFYGDLARVMGH